MDVLGRDRREGLGRKSQSKFGALLLIFVSFFLLLSSLYAAEASVFRKAREAALDAASPILAFFSGPVTFVQDMVGSVEDYFFVLEQNKALREQIDALRQWESEARDLRELISAYETLGFYYPAPGRESVNAYVIGESNDAFVHSMIVNVGRDRGIKPGQAVVDDRGLVGHVVRAAKNASRVLLLTDVQSNIPVYVQGSEVEGILEGRTSANPAIVFTRNDDLLSVEIGQQIVTSGAGGALPRGLPVGKIAGVSSNEASVKLDANYARTRLVRIINYDFTPISEEEFIAAEEAAEKSDDSAEREGDDAGANESAVQTSASAEVN